MKILHTSDWHIGKKVNEFSMIENQKYVFEQIYEIIKNEKIDIVVMAGDVYDKSIVDTDSIKFLEEIINKIVNECSSKIIIISGNHDSAVRISFLNKFLEDSGIFIYGKFNGEINKIVFNDEFGEVNFYPLSYFNEEEIKHIFEDENIKTSDDAFKSILEKVDIDYTKRNVFIGHGYFSNKNMDEMIESESERRLSIGGQEVIDASILENFDYVALGHLHANQKIVQEHIRYSGSIVKYSFSEMKHKKSVTIVELLNKGNVSIKQVELKSKYDMKQIEGFMENLLSKDFYENLNVLDYYRIILHDSIGLSDPVSRLRKVYKNVMEVKFKDSEIEKNNVYGIDNTEIISKSNLELFQGFYEFISGKQINDEQIEILKSVINEVDNLNSQEEVL